MSAAGPEKAIRKSERVRMKTVRVRIVERKVEGLRPGSLSLKPSVAVHG
jgi:hypothetical protein